MARSTNTGFRLVRGREVQVVNTAKEKVALEWAGWKLEADPKPEKAPAAPKQ